MLAAFLTLSFDQNIDFEMTKNNTSLRALQEPMGFTAATVFFVQTCVLVLLGILLWVRFIYELTLKQETSLRVR